MRYTWMDKMHLPASSGGSRIFGVMTLDGWEVTGMGEESERTCNRLQNSMWTYPWDVLDLGLRM